MPRFVEIEIGQRPVLPLDREPQVRKVVADGSHNRCLIRHEAFESLELFPEPRNLVGVGPCHCRALGEGLRRLEPDVEVPGEECRDGGYRE